MRISLLSTKRRIVLHHFFSSSNWYTLAILCSQWYRYTSTKRSWVRMKPGLRIRAHRCISAGISHWQDWLFEHRRPREETFRRRAWWFRCGRSKHGYRDTHEPGTSSMNKSTCRILKSAFWKVEHIITKLTKPREYYPPEGVPLELGPTQGCTEAIKCLRMHCQLLKGSTSKEVLEVFYQEIGIRLIASVFSLDCPTLPSWWYLAAFYRNT